MAQTSLAQGPTSGDGHRLHTVPVEFAEAVRTCLKRYHETDRLFVNPLLGERWFAARGLGLAERIETLRRLLGGAVERLANNPRTELSHRALRFTFLEPAATQLLAAERAGMSFGTYRRHLSAGIEYVVAELWVAIRE